MKVLIITASHPEKTSGRVAKDFASALKMHDFDTKIITKSYDIFLDKTIEYVQSRFGGFLENSLTWPSRFLSKVYKFFGCTVASKTNPKYCDHGFDIISQKFSTGDILKKLSDFEPDAVIIMFMQNFLTFQNLSEIQKRYNSPIYIYLMDMAPLTGGCHYAWDCEGYKINCGRCPALYSNNSSDQSAINLKYKKDIVMQHDFIPVAASSWQRSQLANSSVFNFSKKGFILSPTDENQFRPVNKQFARSFFKIDDEKKVIFLGSVTNVSIRKGSHYSYLALKNLASRMTIEERRNIKILIAGSEKPIVEDLGFSILFLGKLNYDTLVLAYNASTLFLNSSIEDSGPTMINQAIMCGIPVVSFNMGVAQDLIINGETGYIADLMNTEDMAFGIGKILNLDSIQYEQYSQNCRNLAISKCGFKSTADSFLKLHNDVKKV